MLYYKHVEGSKGIKLIDILRSFYSTSLKDRISNLFAGGSRITQGVKGWNLRVMLGLL